MSQQPCDIKLVWHCGTPPLFALGALQVRERFGS
jgi:hypothetical protein